MLSKISQYSCIISATHQNIWTPSFAKIWHHQEEHKTILKPELSGTNSFFVCVSDRYQLLLFFMKTQNMWQPFEYITPTFWCILTNKKRVKSQLWIPALYQLANFVTQVMGTLGLCLLIAVEYVWILQPLLFLPALWSNEFFFCQCC